ncbi:McrC family protein [Sulfuricurvum sp.]|uniref:McrC family protein n=1 Tax=Sulfuricurvum sp. TaxID=2025608 RepID=UPI003BB6FDEB
MMQCKNKATISEFGLIGRDDSVCTANKFLSANICETAYKELEEFAKTDNGKDVLGFSGNGKYLQAKSYVGTIQTKSGFTLEILPKISSDKCEAADNEIENSKQIFMTLLHLLHKLPNFKQIDTAKFEVQKLDIFEIFILMFLEEVGQIIKKGIKSDYSTQEENLFFLKGKLRFGEHLKRNIVHKERFYVEYDDYNQNRPENRLIKSTLNFLSKVSKNANNVRRIRLYMEHMNWVDLSMNVENDFRGVKVGRGMDHYKNALKWSEVFLKKKSFTSFSGETISFAILYPMEKLFECFVEWWLNKKYPHLTIEPQNGGVEFVKKLFTVRPDFVIKNAGEICCIADAKWKLIDKEGDFSQGDFYQLFAYKHIFFDKNLTSDCLRIYYPKTDFLTCEKYFEYHCSSKIKIVPLDLKILIKKQNNE